MSVQVGATYEHYKGQRYRVLALGREESTLTPVVVYQALYDSPEFGEQPVWVRPQAEFDEIVEVDGTERPRFKLVE